MRCRPLFQKQLAVDSRNGIIGGNGNKLEGYFNFQQVISLQAATATNLGPTGFFTALIVPESFVGYILAAKIVCSGMGSLTGFGALTITTQSTDEVDLFHQSNPNNVPANPVVPLGYAIGGLAGQDFDNLYNSFGYLDRFAIPQNYQINAQMAAPPGQLTACSGLYQIVGMLVKDSFDAESQNF